MQKGYSRAMAASSAPLPAIINEATKILSIAPSRRSLAPTGPIYTQKRGVGTLGSKSEVRPTSVLSPHAVASPDIQRCMFPPKRIAAFRPVQLHAFDASGITSLGDLRALGTLEFPCLEIALRLRPRVGEEPRQRPPP